MKKYLAPFVLIFCFHLSARSQQITFDDGTKINVNKATFDYEDIRRASIGPVLYLDGLGGSKLLTASYLQPEKFHIAANVGFASISLETSIFFTGNEKQRNKGFAIKYEPAGYRTLKQYVLSHPVRKRKEWGVYLAMNDYGHLLKESTDEDRVDHYSVLKQTKVYAGIVAVNYWHSNINVDNNFMRRGHYIGRTILAPFITFGSVADTSNYTINDAPRYGARIMYELSNTFGLLGGKIRGRTNLILRLGYEIGIAKNNNTYSDIIFGFGMVYNFAEGRSLLILQ